MSKTINTDVLKKAIAHYGTTHQIDKCVEEMAELTQAIIKHRHNYSQNNRRHIVEELADVYITLAQLELIINDNDLLEKYIDGKLNRLKSNIEKDD